MDAFNTGSTTIIIPPLTVIERQLQEDSMKYGIKVLVGSQVGSEFRVFSKPVHHFQLCALSIDGPLAQMSTEDFEAAMSRSRPQILIWVSFPRTGKMAFSCLFFSSKVERSCG